MRIAVHVDGDLGTRTTRVLLAEEGTEVGLFGGDRFSSRVHPVDRLADWDVLVIDEISPSSRRWLDEATASDIPVVIGEAVDDPNTPSATLVSGVLDGAHLALALLGLEECEEVMEAQLAWTIEGHPLTDGAAVTFPDPVGPLWADAAEMATYPYPTRGLVAPCLGPWRAVTARVTCATPDGMTQRIHGLSDDRDFMNAIVLAAAALSAAAGAYPSGMYPPGDAGGVFLRHAERAGLHIASFSPTPR